MYTLIFFYFERGFLEIENTNVFRKEKNNLQFTITLICNFESILQDRESVLKIFFDC